MDELNWDEIAERFSAARNWWVSTTGTGGPHAVPVWGVLANSQLVFYGATSSKRSRNLALDSRVSVHLESGDSPLIIRGTATPAGLAAQRPELISAYQAKYTEPWDAEYLPDTPYGATVVSYNINPISAMAWSFAPSTEFTIRRWSAPKN